MLIHPNQPRQSSYPTDPSGLPPVLRKFSGFGNRIVMIAGGGAMLFAVLNMVGMLGYAANKELRKWTAYKPIEAVVIEYKPASVTTDGFGEKKTHLGEIHYRFMLGKREQTGTYAQDPKDAGHNEYAGPLQRPFAKGEKLTAYYDPAEPYYSTLAPVADPIELAFGIALTPVPVMAVAMILIGIFGKPGRMRVIPQGGGKFSLGGAGPFVTTYFVLSFFGTGVFLWLVSWSHRVAWRDGWYLGAAMIAAIVPISSLAIGFLVSTFAKWRNHGIAPSEPIETSAQVAPPSLGAMIGEAIRAVKGQREPEKLNLVPVQIAISTGGWVKKWLILGCIMLFWCGLTGVFVGIVGVSFYKTVVAQSTYQTAHGQMVASKVQASSGGGSDSKTTYTAIVRYKYSVGGATYTSDRYSYGNWGSSDNRATNIVASLPPGKDVTVYYDPAKPGESVLLIQIESSTCIMLLAMQPFAIVGLAIIFAFVGLPLARQRIRRFLLARPNFPMSVPGWGTLQAARDVLSIQGRRTFLLPMMLTYGVAIFLSIFVAVIAIGVNNVTIDHVEAATASCLGLAVLAGLLSLLRRKSFLTINFNLKRLTLISTKRTVDLSLDQIESWIVKPSEGGRFKRVEGSSTTLVTPLLAVRCADGQEFPLHLFGAAVTYMIGEEIPCVAAKTVQILGEITGKPATVLAEPSSLDPTKIPQPRGSSRSISVSSTRQYNDLK